MTDLRPYQAEYVEQHALDAAHYLAWDPRTGKTRAEARAMRRRVLEARVTRLLVIGPKKPLSLSWEPELRAVGFDNPSRGGGELGYLVPLQGTRAGKTLWCAEILREILRGAGADRPTVILFNYEILEKKWDPAKKIRISDLLGKWEPQSITVDESHLIQTAGSLRSRAMARLTNHSYFRRCLSGTPDPNGWVSFYSQYKFLEPAIFGTNKNKFLNRFFIVNPFVAGRPESIRPETLPELQSKVFGVMSRVRAADYFKMQDPEPFTRSIPWPGSRARQLYDKLVKKDVLAEHDDEDLVVDGTHWTTKLLRLFQLCDGYLIDEISGEIRWLHQAKDDAVSGDLGEILASDKRAVVSFVHTTQGRRLYDHLAAVYGTEAVAYVDGHTADAEAILDLFNINNTKATPIKVLVVQEAVGGVGISLARAEYLLFASWSMNSADHEQMKKRVWDPSRPCFIGYYQMADSADTFRRRVVQTKRDASVMVTQYSWFDIANGKVPDANDLSVPPALPQPVA